MLIAGLSMFASSAVTEATVHSEKIILGSGCFWGAEKGYEALPGVIDAVSGYSDGDGVRPTYREITKLKNKFNPNNLYMQKHHQSIIILKFRHRNIRLLLLSLLYLNNFTSFNAYPIFEKWLKFALLSRASWERPP